jgi:hypothetical protein
MAPKRYTLYWSSLDLYEGCPQRYLWQKGWGAIDVGGGPGRPKPKPVKKSEHHAVMGTVIQAVLEHFYNDELWKLLQPVELKARLLEMAEEFFKLEVARRYVDWRLSPPIDEVKQVIRDGILGYMRTLKEHKLLGPYARAEVELLGYIDKYTPVGGRADMIIRREDTGITILDGKNGKRYKDGKGGTMTYTDPDQLRWYALLFYLCHQKLPDRLGFVYFRYPFGNPILDDEGNPTGETEKGIDWVDFTKEDVKGLAQRGVDARRSMDKERFDANPSPKQCRLCDYETVCPQRQSQKDANRRTPKAKPGDLKLQEFQVFSFGGGGESSRKE